MLQDHPKSYTKEELLDMSIRNFDTLRTSIQKAIDSLISPEDKVVLDKYQEFVDLPYLYAHNPAAFDYQRVQEAVTKFKEIDLLKSQAESVKQKVRQQIPPNIWSTLMAIKSIREK